MIWWQVYPLGFLGAEDVALPADAPVQHRLPALLAWLDYLVELGCNGLALNPLFASETHGYDIVDHFAVDPRLGDDADVDELIAACHAQGDPGAVRRRVPSCRPSVSRFRRRARARAGIELGPAGSTSIGTQTVPTASSTGTSKDTTRWSPWITRRPAVADYVSAVMEHWLERGIDGWRLDAAYALPLPFWRTVTDRVKSRFPDSWLVGEVIHGEFTDWVEQGGLDSVTQYELWKSTWSSLNDGNFFELDWTLERHRTSPSFSAR